MVTMAFGAASDPAARPRWGRRRWEPEAAPADRTWCKRDCSKYIGPLTYCEAVEPKPLILTEHDAAVHAALLELKAVLLDCADNVDEVLTRVAESYNTMRAAGEGWSDIMQQQQQPLALTRLHERINDVVAAGAALRRAVVAGLLAEGVSKSQIGKVLGLSHQRVVQITRD